MVDENTSSIWAKIGPTIFASPCKHQYCPNETRRCFIARKRKKAVQCRRVEYGTVHVARKKNEKSLQKILAFEQFNVLFYFYIHVFFILKHVNL
jgi:hypothetical protein